VTQGNSVPFVKATACGNDFILIEGKFAPADADSFTRTICDRHNGIGADGVEWLYPADDQNADLRIRLINADGSPAELSGNGTRCVAAWLSAERGLTSPRIATDAGVKVAKLLGRDGNRFEFETKMGKAAVGKELTIDLGGEIVRGLQISMGNPQFISFVGRFADDWQRLGAAVSTHKQFPEGTNFEFVKVVNPHEIEIRIFERGAGETMSSGTGSSASAVAAISTGRVQSPVKVVAPGGSQTVTWEDDEVTLTGPAQILCRGEFYL
jgi:diaminopimelate epimerase